MLLVYSFSSELVFFFFRFGWADSDERDVDVWTYDVDVEAVLELLALCSQAPARPGRRQLGEETNDESRRNRSKKDERPLTKGRAPGKDMEIVWENRAEGVLDGRWSDEDKLLTEKKYPRPSIDPRLAPKGKERKRNEKAITKYLPDTK